MKKFRMPPALIIVMIFLFIVGIMTWFIPTSVVVTNDAGESEIIYNAAFDADGNVIENAGTDPVGLWDLFLAPVQGFANAADVAMAILVSGGLLAILNKSGSLDARHQRADQAIQGQYPDRHLDDRFRPDGYRLRRVGRASGLRNYYHSTLC